MKIAIIGCGSLGTALARGWQQVSGFSVELFDRRRSVAELSGCDVIIIAVKPKDVRGVIDGIQTYVADALLVSCAAGLSVDPNIARAMPNTASSMLAGTTGLYCTKESDRSRLEQVFSAIGEVCWLKNEHDFHALTALSGSGPAFVLRLAQAMIDEGVSQGLTEADAKLLAKGAVRAAAALLQSEYSPRELIGQIASPGGVTAAGLAVLDAVDLRKIITKACERSGELI